LVPASTTASSFPSPLKSPRTTETGDRPTGIGDPAAGAKPPADALGAAIASAMTTEPKVAIRVRIVPSVPDRGSAEPPGQGGLPRPISPRFAPAACRAMATPLLRSRHVLPISAGARARERSGPAPNSTGASWWQARDVSSFAWQYLERCGRFAAKSPSEHGGEGVDQQIHPGLQPALTSVVHGRPGETLPRCASGGTA
jgi:hypothetical protein